MDLSNLPECAESRLPVMPNFAEDTHGFAHTVDSAIPILERLGVSESNITLRMAGPGRPHLEIVRQSPRHGTELAPSVAVTLWVAGLGFFDALPMPMRESGGEAGMGTREICQVFDDPIQKAAQWFRAGVLLFEIGPGRYAACRRWLSLFGIAHEDWPEHLLYPLSLLAPSLSRMAGREIGIRFTFLVIFGIPVNQIRYKRSYRFLGAEQRSALGSQCGRIGRDFILGDRLGDCDRMVIQLGPVSLDIFEWFETAEGKRLLQMTTALCVSAYQSFSIEWLIEDAQQAPRLGKPVENSRLGLNFHLGRKGSS